MKRTFHLLIFKINLKFLSYFFLTYYVFRLGHFTSRLGHCDGRYWNFLQVPVLWIYKRKWLSDFLPNRKRKLRIDINRTSTRRIWAIFVHKKNFFCPDHKQHSLEVWKERRIMYLGLCTRLRTYQLSSNQFYLFLKMAQGTVHRTRCRANCGSTSIVQVSAEFGPFFHKTTNWMLMVSESSCSTRQLKCQRRNQIRFLKYNHNFSF